MSIKSSYSFHPVSLHKSLVASVLFSAAFVAAVALPIFTPPQAFAADAPVFAVSGSTWLKDNLQKAVGTKVTLRLIAGEEITGTVVAVGDEAVHLSAISGRDFYDAVISLEMVSAVIVNVRGK